MTGSWTDGVENGTGGNPMSETHGTRFRDPNFRPNVLIGENGSDGKG